MIAPWRDGDWVAVRPDQGMVQALREIGVCRTDRLLVKKVAASAGDLVCRSGLVVSINARLVATARVTASNGAVLPVWSGCRRLTTTEVFLLNPAPGSFEGLYFGPTARDLVIGPVAFVNAHPPDELVGNSRFSQTAGLKQVLVRKSGGRSIPDWTMCHAKSDAK